jgi:hypothetical protein
MNTNKKGDIGLLKTMLELTEKNYFCFTPISDTTCVDLVVANENMELRKIQTKYCSLTDGRMEICTSTVVNGKKVPVDLTKIDIWAVYCPDNNKIYYIKSKDLVGRKTMKIRVEEPKVMSKQINMGDKYLDISQAW